MVYAGLKWFAFEEYFLGSGHSVLDECLVYSSVENILSKNTRCIAGVGKDRRLQRDQDLFQHCSAALEAGACDSRPFHNLELLE